MLHPDVLACLTEETSTGSSHLVLQNKLINAAMSIEASDDYEVSKLRLKVTDHDVRNAIEALLATKLGLRVAGSTQLNMASLLSEGGDELHRKPHFLYQPVTQTKRFLFGLMTQEIAANARKHCHRGVFYVDETFNLTLEKVLGPF